MDLRCDPERQGVLHGSGRAGLEQLASFQQVPQVVGRRRLPGIGLARATAGCRIEGLAAVASIDSAAAMSAASATRSARAMTSAAWPIDTPLAEINANPSLPLSTSGVIPARRSASSAREQLALVLGPPESDRDLSHPGHRLDIRRPDRTDRRDDRMDSGVQHGRQHVGDRREAPDPPRAIPLSRTANAARTRGAGSGGPIPPLCDLTMNICSPRISSSVIRVSLPWPICVVRP